MYPTDTQLLINNRVHLQVHPTLGNRLIIRRLVAKDFRKRNYLDGTKGL